MDFIKWDESFSVGVKLIDAQHQKLFKMINTLHNSLKKIENGGSEPLENVILQLAAYVDFHFKTEEKYFHEFDYEKTKEHEAQHKFYEDKIKEFNDKYQKGAVEEEVGVEVLKFLEEWIMKHIKVNDKEYTKCFNEHGLA